MKRLTLVRHAHAKVQDPPVTDFERPLSRRGKSEAKATAVLLLAQGLIPDLMIASPAKRTLQTAAILVRELHVAERQLRHDETLYLATADALLNVLRGTGPRIEHLMIIGHNPGISVLANFLAPEAALGEFATAAACTMEFEVGSWSAINAGSATKAARKSRAPRLFGLFK
jgi:phosphohistidine phosphatase